MVNFIFENRDETVSAEFVVILRALYNSSIVLTSKTRCRRHFAVSVDRLMTEYVEFAVEVDE